MQLGEVEIILRSENGLRIARRADWAGRPAELPVTKPEFIWRSGISRTANTSDACLNAPAARPVKSGDEMSDRRWATRDEVLRGASTHGGLALGPRRERRTGGAQTRP